MPNRRILSLWFPRLGVERLLRRESPMDDLPTAVVEEVAGAQRLSSVNAAAEAVGLAVGRSLADAQAMYPDLLIRDRDVHAEARFLAALRRWAVKFSPWIAEEPPAALVIDLTGCAHLFGGEAALIDQVRLDCADLRLTVSPGIADTLGAAWALARYAGARPGSHRSGDAIDQEAPATRSRAAKRGRMPDLPALPREGDNRIAPPGMTVQALNPLPVAALRLPPDTVAELGRLGLRRVGQVLGQPRAGLARRFGRLMVERMDQAIGAAPEPISPAPPETRFSVRLSLPDPIGLESDVLAAIDRLLPPLCDKLTRHGRGARRLRLECLRADGTRGTAELGFAHPANAPERMRPMLEMKLPGIEAGFGIDAVRLIATVTERLPTEHRGHLAAAEDARTDETAESRAIDDLIARLGTRIGLERITRPHPGDSHIPEKGTRILAAAWSEPARDWPAAPTPRPLFLWPPEPVTAPATPQVPAAFRWRNRSLDTAHATGPERIAPEWWLDDPNWRSGTRDYWRVTCASGDCLWLFYAHGAALSPGWFCQGSFG